MLHRSTTNAGLIGHTGFVGGNLNRQARFAKHYNSRNFRDLGGQGFELLVCAGVSAAKWIANKEPDQDRERIRQLTDVLATVSVEEFILISTIDVYPEPAVGGNEDTAIDAAANSAYGRHRYELEQWAASHFGRCRIVRLPALFGPGLRKNALFDLLHDNQVHAINPAGIYQWYPVGRLWSDIEIARRANLKLVNLFTQPLPMGRIIESYFPGAPVGPSRSGAATYRVETRHARLFGGANGFLMSADACLAEIGRYVAGERQAR
jgi:hypothetical protein